MKVLYAAVFLWRSDDESPLKLATAEDLSSFSFFERTTIREHLTFASRTTCQRTSAGVRQTVTLTDIPFVCHVHVRQDRMAGVVICDSEYPVRVAFSLIGRFMRAMDTEHANEWANVTADANLAIADMDADLKRYQNPENADKLTQVQKNLDDVKDIMHKNIEEILKRGETIDSLMAKSEDLTGISVAFYKGAKRNNQCCKMY
ncbi:V-SNARE coiled-coil homology domain-containing protein [Plasmodiophora brassicae]|uniref:V-SNARE coiled-coil homology domain-containing protein n=1 Tax=Plasmodiophora brassicae TaxID=37360 RepID=A0A0G4IPN0_PLABS|nr:hypothetical protein PBRA_005725 [Plasmodiophora brassicae]SPR01098.1 unnamed protein product [Plasmodiophora brassicae]